MKRLYALQLDKRKSNILDYLSLKEAQDKCICIKKEDENIFINTELVDYVEKALKSSFMDPATALTLYNSDLEDEEELKQLEEADLAKRAKVLKYYFSWLCADGIQLTNEQYNELYQLGFTLSTQSLFYFEVLDIVCQALAILKGKPFINGRYYTDIPGKWFDYVCAKDMEDYILKNIAPVYSRINTYFKIMFLDDNDLETDDLEYIANKINKSAEAFEDYTDLTDIDEIKDWLAKSASNNIEKYNKDNVIILIPDGKYIVEHYKYVKV